MTLLRYNSVIIIEEAQFGISPIKLEIIGANTFPFKNILPINSWFTKLNNVFKIKVTKNINIKVLLVWIILDFIIDSSHSHFSSSHIW